MSTNHKQKQAKSITRSMEYKNTRQKLLIFIKVYLMSTVVCLRINQTNNASVLTHEQNIRFDRTIFKSFLPFDSQIVHTHCHYLFEERNHITPFFWLTMQVFFVVLITHLLSIYSNEWFALLVFFNLIHKKNQLTNTYRKSNSCLLEQSVVSFLFYIYIYTYTCIIESHHLNQTIYTYGFLIKLFLFLHT